MLNKRLHDFWIPSTERVSQRQHKIWFGLSIAITIIYSAIELRNGFQAEYVVQDDARQHVFWMLRFLDPGLFPGDVIADYYQSIAPIGFTLFYRVGAFLGINPFGLNKVLPMLLAIATTCFTYRVTLQLLPIPAAGFVGSLLLIQNLWLHDDLGSGTARSFIYPIFMAFLYYLLRRSLIPGLITIVLAATFYPQYIFLMSGILLLRLLRWERGPRWVGDRATYWMTGLGLVVAVGMMVPFALQNSQYGPVVTLEQARSMLEFGPRGRNLFFDDNPWVYWGSGPRTGAVGWMMPLSMVSVPLLPLLMQFPRRFPLMQRVRHTAVLLQFALVSVGMFLAAHALLFRLYLPSRYSQNSWYIISALAGAVVGLALLDGAFRLGQRLWPKIQQGWAIAMTAIAVVVLLGSPHIYHFPNSSYVIGSADAVYEFLASQPKDTLIAGVSIEMDRLPSFSQRSVLVAREYAIPYHTRYYSQMRQRSIDTLQATYSPTLEPIQRVIQEYGVDYWLVEREFMTSTNPKKNSDQERVTRWINQYQPIASQIEQQLKRGIPPALTALEQPCTVVSTPKLSLLDAQCILTNGTELPPTGR